MRYILMILVLICSLTASSQVKQTYSQYGGLWNRLALKYNGGFQLPRTTLSTRDLNVSAPDTGQVYYNPVDSSVYYNTGSQWIKFATGSFATPTLQDVILAGHYVHDTSIYAGQNFMIRWDYAGAGNPVGQYNSGTNSMRFYNIAGNHGIDLDFSMLSGVGLKKFKYRNSGQTLDTLATLYDVRSGGSTPTLQDVFNTEVGGSVLTKDDTVLLGTKVLNFNGSSTAYRFANNSVSWSHINSSGFDYGFTFGGGSIQLFRTPNSSGSVSSLMRLQPDYAELNSQSTFGPESFVRVYPDSIRIAAQDGFVTAPGLQQAAGTKALRYNPGTGKITYADTTSGGSGTNNANVGSGYRWLKPGTQEIKTFRGESGIILDSSSHTDEITAKADTAVGNAGSLVTNADFYRRIDSLNQHFIQIDRKTRYDYWLTIPGGSGSVGTFSYGFGGTGSTNIGITGASFLPLGWLFGARMETGTQSSGRAYHWTQASGTYANMSMSSSYRYNYGVNLRLDDLSDGTDTYTVCTGFLDNNNNPPAVEDGVYFRYTHSDSSGKWIACTRNNSNGSTNITEVATSITVAADTDYILEISVIGGNAFFYIDNVLKATISTNIPDDDVNRITGAINLIQKSAGTTNRIMYTEWIGLGKRSN